MVCLPYISCTEIPLSRDVAWESSLGPHLGNGISTLYKLDRDPIVAGRGLRIEFGTSFGSYSRSAGRRVGDGDERERRGARDWLYMAGISGKRWRPARRPRANSLTL